MKLNSLKPAEGSTKTRKRIGRGPGSGLGGTSTRGHKGAKSRSGYSKKIGFEGGQMPLQRRVPKFAEDALFVFSKIENVRFRKPVFPGDTILYRVELNAPPKASFCSLKGYAFVGETMVSEAEFIAQVSRK